MGSIILHHRLEDDIIIRTMQAMARVLDTVHEDVGEDSAGGREDHERMSALSQRHALAATPWPADRLVCGGLEVRGSATRRTRLDRKVGCTIQHGVITFYEPAQTGAEAVILAREQVSSIIATIVPDQTRKFSICSGLEHIDSTQVWCCAKDQVNRNEWLAVLHRLGVDLYCEYDGGEIRCVRRGLQRAD